MATNKSLRMKQLFRQNVIKQDIGMQVCRLGSCMRLHNNNSPYVSCWQPSLLCLVSSGGDAL